MQTYKNISWVKTIKNQQFTDNLKSIGPESCLITPNVNKSCPLFLTSSQHKRTTYLSAIVEDINLQTGEVQTDYVIISRNDIEDKKKRARSKLLAIASILEPIECKAPFPKPNKYKPVLITLTMPQHNCSIREFLNKYKISLKRKKVDLLYSFWAFELGKNGNHPHYHVVIWVRDFQSLTVFYPELYGWVGRTQVEPIIKSVYNYLCKYFVKHDNYIRINGRNYGYGQLSCPLKKFYRKTLL